MTENPFEFTGNRRALLELLIKEQGLQEETHASAGSLPGRPAGAPLVLSYSQQRLWFLDQLEPNQATYNIPSAIHLTGQLDVTLLECCLNQIIQRHEVLRTNFVTESGQPVPILWPARSLRLQHEDLSHLPPEKKDVEVQRLAAVEADRPFVLSHDLLMRATLLRLADDDHILLLTLHHIIADRGSMDILAREFAALYSARGVESRASLAELPVQYADFALWQRGWLEGQGVSPGPDRPAGSPTHMATQLQEQLAYWKKLLDGALPQIELPNDSPQPASDDHSGHRLSARLPAKVFHSLHHLAQAESASLFMVFLAGLNLLLQRHSGQEDILVGSPISGRSRPELENMVGLFLNTLVLRTDLSGNPTFRELLTRVRATALGAYEHQDLPFEKLVEELQPERCLNRNPLFDVLINYTEQSERKIEIPGLKLAMLSPAEPESKFWITLYICQEGKSVELELVYRKSLFSEGRMAAFFDQYQVLLAQVAENPNAPIGSYSLVTPDSHRLLPDPSVELACPPQELVAELVASWSLRAPDHPAVSQGGRTWSYHELFSRAEELARLLVIYGIRNGEVVAVSGNRSFGLYAAMLGVFMSGGVLLSLDPGLPAARRQQMLKEANARLVLFAGEAARPKELLTLPWLRILPATGKYTGPVTQPNRQAVNLPVVSPDTPAYIFFTSGTTGVPKAVLGSHQGLSHFLNWQRETFAVGPLDRAAQLTGLSFDVVLRDIFLPLTSGATLCLPAEQEALDPKRLLAWLKREGITILHTVPSIVQNWLSVVDQKLDFPRLRWVFFAGEPLPASLVNHWRGANSHIAGLVNLYGPTETTLAKCFYFVPTRPSAGIQPVGWPLPQTQALVLGKSGQRCGISEIGEIVIRTPFRTFGYINAPDEMVKRFIRNPSRQDPQDLLYFTGDLGRYRPDGALEILGRMDHQVKIHGVRIEPDEVNAVLQQHPEVRSSAVVAVKNEAGQYQLVAYLAGRGERELPGIKLRSYLAERLPAALIPAAFVYLEKLPLSPNGKLDRSALPAILPSVEQASQARANPKDKVERQLLEIWKKLLQREAIGTRDDFFGLGGHSMLAVQMFVQIQETFGVNLPLTSLFREATIESLSDLIRKQIGLAAWSSLVEIQSSGNRLPFFCVHGITGDVYWFGDLVSYLHPDQPIWGLQSLGIDGVQQPLIEIEAMAAHYIDEIRSLQPDGPYLIGGYSYGGTVAFEMARQLEGQGQRVALLAILDHATPKSDYFQVNYSPRFLLGFLMNLPYRVTDFLRLGPRQIQAYLKRKAQNYRQELGRLLRRAPGERAGVGAGDIIDEAGQLPLHIQRLIEINYRAIQNYEPGNYSGKITLLRARGGRLVCSHDPAMGWGKFAAGGVDVRMISGSHRRIFHQPNICSLVAQLQACLDEAQGIKPVSK